MEWYWVALIAGGVASSIGFTAGFISRALTESARDEAQYFAPVWAEAYAADAIDKHEQEFHIPQQQLMERQARAEEVRAALKADVV
jgi:hypothetical protein